MAQVGREGEAGGIERRAQVRQRLRMAHRHRAGHEHVHIAHQSHVFIRRHGVPVHEGEGEIVLGGREDFDGQGIDAAGRGEFGDIEFEHAVHARGLVRGSDLVAVEPDVGAVIDGIEIQPEGLAFGGGGQAERGAVPPRFGEGAIVGHGQVGKIHPRLVAHARIGAKVHAEIGVGVDLVGHQRGDYGGGNGSGVPIARLERGGGHHGAIFRHMGGSLDAPVAIETDAGGRLSQQNRAERGQKQVTHKPHSSTPREQSGAGWHPARRLATAARSRSEKRRANFQSAAGYQPAPHAAR